MCWNSRKQDTSNGANNIKEMIRKGCYGEKVKVEVKIVDKIQRDKSGKLRKVISKVKK